MRTKRNETDFTGVFYSTMESDQEFYVQYEKDGESVEKMVGPASLGMSAEKAKTLCEKIIEDDQ